MLRSRVITSYSIHYTKLYDKHVFAEKPVAVDPTGIRTVIAAAEAAKEKNPNRPVLTDEQYERVASVAPKLDWRFQVALTRNNFV